MKTKTPQGTITNEGDDEGSVKESLLQMARNGEERPKTTFAISLSSYLNHGGNAYDSDFDKQIRKAAPNWFKPVEPESPKQYQCGVVHNGEIVDHCGHLHDTWQAAQDCPDKPHQRFNNTGPAFNHVLIVWETGDWHHYKRSDAE